MGYEGAGPVRTLSDMSRGEIRELEQRFKCKVRPRNQEAPTALRYVDLSRKDGTLELTFRGTTQYRVKLLREQVLKIHPARLVVEVPWKVACQFKLLRYRTAA